MLYEHLGFSPGTQFRDTRVTIAELGRFPFYWVAVKDLNLSYYVEETMLIAIYIYIPIMVT